MYQTVEHKQRFIGQVFGGSGAASRSADDIDQAALSLRGRSRRLRRGPGRERAPELQNELPRLASLERAHRRDQAELRRLRDEVRPLRR